MKLQYSGDTDTIYIEFCADAISESCDLDENTLLELDATERLCSMTMEHASLRTDAKNIVVKKIAA